jgi:hypothetical protein
MSAFFQPPARFSRMNLICHCEAGISRSAGTAAALAELFGESADRFFKYPYNHNRLVYQKVLAAGQSTQ